MNALHREDLNLDCICQMGLVMRDDGQGLEKMIMFEFCCYKESNFCRLY